MIALEKMAAAIEQAYCRQQADEPVDWIDCARAALQAIREPDEAVLHIGDLKAAFLWGYAKGSGGGLSAGDQDWLLYRRALSGNA